MTPIVLDPIEYAACLWLQRMPLAGDLLAALLSLTVGRPVTNVTDVVERLSALDLPISQAFYTEGALRYSFAVGDHARCADVAPIVARVEALVRDGVFAREVRAYEARTGTSEIAPVLPGDSEPMSGSIWVAGSAFTDEEGAPEGFCAGMTIRARGVVTDDGCTPNPASTRVGEPGMVLANRDDLGQVVYVVDGVPNVEFDRNGIITIIGDNEIDVLCEVRGLAPLAYVPRTRAVYTGPDTVERPPPVERPPESQA